MQDTWISVEDQLPEESGPITPNIVLCYVPKLDTLTMSPYKKGWYSHAAEEWIFLDTPSSFKVSHWQPYMPPYQYLYGNES